MSSCDEGWPGGTGALSRRACVGPFRAIGLGGVRRFGLGWMDATVKAAMDIAAGGAPAGTVSAAAIALSDLMVGSMLMTKLKWTVVALLAAGGTAFVLAAFVLAGQEDGTMRKDATPARNLDQPSRPFPIAGVVVDSTSGKPVAGVAVVVRRTVGDQSAGEHRLESDAAGRFRLELPAGWVAPAEARISVDVQAPPGHFGFPYRTQYGESTDDGIPLAELRREQEVGVPPFFARILLFPTKRIKGRVAAPDGSPAAGVDVVACSVSLKDKVVSRHRLVRRTRTGADGRFEAEVASPGPVVVYLLTGRYAPRAVKLTDPVGDLGVYTLEAGVEVHGKLRDARDRPIANSWVRVGGSANRLEIDEELWNVGLGSPERWCRTIADGTFHTAPLAPGVYEASAHGPGRDELGGRMRMGEPLESCVIPQNVTVTAAGEIPRTVLRAVPHVVVEVRVADRQGRSQGCRVKVPYRFTFNGKEYRDVIESPVAVVDGRAKLFVPHGTPLVNLSNGVYFDDPSFVWAFDLPGGGPFPREQDGISLMRRTCSC